MTAPEPRSRQLSDMADCAYRLGMAFGAAAETAQGTDQWLPYFNAFDRCFFAVRVSTALELRLRRAPAETREAASDREELIERPETTTGTEDRDRGYDERDRDRDRETERETERASQPILLRALEGVVADAAALPDPKPAELLTLRELIAHARSEPGPAAPRSPASNVRQVLTARRATGPPRR